jgi:hypothetical protein
MSNQDYTLRAHLTKQRRESLDNRMPEVRHLIMAQTGVPPLIVGYSSLSVSSFIANAWQKGLHWSWLAVRVVGSSIGQVEELICPARMTGLHELLTIIVYGKHGFTY